MTPVVWNSVFPISKIVTHVNPHIDEICGIWLLRKFGRDRFPGIETATIEFWSAGNAELQKKECDLAIEEHTLLVGIGGGIFDEHPTVDNERKKDKCAATLIAEYLGVDDDPALETILDFVQRNDLNGNRSMSDIASVCLKMYKILPAEKVMNWATLALEALYREQAEFAQGAVEEYRKARIWKVVDSDIAKVAVIESDNDMVAKFARATRGGGATLVIQKQNTGNVQIFSNRKFHPNMEKIARFIRLAEQRAKGKLITLKPEELEREGSVRGAEEWHFFKKGRMLLNGSLSHPDVPPTNLALEEIARIVCNCAH